jgi:hypothetical protein
MKQASRLVDQRMGIIDKENVDDNVFNNIINDTTEDDYVKPVITVSVKFSEIKSKKFVLT